MQYDDLSYWRVNISTAKIAISIDSKLLEKIDDLVRGKIFANRSKAIQKAIVEIIEKFDKNRLARECAKLDTSYEQVLADEGLSKDMETWPEY